MMRRIDVDQTSFGAKMKLYLGRCDVMRRIDVDQTSFSHQMPAGI